MTTSVHIFRWWCTCHKTCKRFCDTENMFWIWSFHNLSQVKTTQRTKTTSGGHGGELLSQHQTRALAAHMNGIRGDPSTVSLSAVAHDNGHSGKHIMWCTGLDAHWLHRTATLMIWATFLWTEPYEALEVHKSVPPCFITQYARKLSEHMSLPLDKDNLIHCRNRFGKLENTGSVRTKGVRGLVFLLTTHQEEISLWPNCVIFVLKLKAILQYEIHPKELDTPMSPIISVEYRPPVPPPPLWGPFYLFRDKSLAE